MTLLILSGFGGPAQKEAAEEAQRGILCCSRRAVWWRPLLSAAYLYSFTPTLVPSSRVTSFRKTVGAMSFCNIFTLPSQKTTLAPAGWKLKISSFGPQLFVPQGQSVGPPTGEALLLITDLISPATVLGGPETPLPVSGSAQRLFARLPLGVLTSAFPAAIVGRDILT